MECASEEHGHHRNRSRAILAAWFLLDGGLWGRGQCFVVTKFILPGSLTASLPLNIGHPNRKGSSSNHHFPGIISLLNFRGVFHIIPRGRLAFIDVWVLPKIVVPQNGWFIVENPMNKWMIWGETPLFLETPIWYLHLYEGNPGTREPIYSPSRFPTVFFSCFGRTQFIDIQMCIYIHMYIHLNTHFLEYIFLCLGII